MTPTAELGASLTATGVAIAAFASTNVDDIVLLAALFSDPTTKRRSVVMGQFLGIGVLVGASLLAARLAWSVPSGWVALLGLVPLVLGLLKLRSFLADSQQPSGTSEQAVRTREHEAAERLHSQILAVASITVANGGDNLGVYIPLFTSTANASVYVGVFALMTGLWCVLGYYAVHNPMIGSTVRRYGPIVLPFVLIGIGLYILSGSFVLFG